MPHEGDFSPAYFADFASTTRRSANVVVPLILMQLANRKPASVLDLGCGYGAWLASWRAHGVAGIHGVDGPWVARKALEIPPERFESFDLTLPYSPRAHYDVAMCLEVGQYLPQRAATTLVETLVRASPVVVFSSAVPHQTGPHMVNGQWPRYWADLFGAHAYSCVDSLRPLIWTDERIDWWCRQNIMLFVRSPSLLLNFAAVSPLPLVHPEMYTLIRNWGVTRDRDYWELWKRFNS